MLKGFWNRIFRREPEPDLRGTIEELIEEDENENAGSSLAPDEREMLTNILQLKGLVAEDVMVPRANIVSASIDSSYEEIIEIFKKNYVSRLLVHKGNLDDAIGYINLRDMLGQNPAKFKLTEHIQRIEFIAPSMGVLDLLLQMRTTGTRMALVIDEYGGVDGLVTMGDIIEEIVGDIQGVSENGSDIQFFIRPDGVIVVDAKMELEDFEEKTGIKLTDSEEPEHDTIGGLVCDTADRVPQRGELIDHPSGISFEILEANPRQVKRIAIHGMSQKNDAEN